MEQPVFGRDWHVYMQSMPHNDISKQQTAATIIYMHLKPFSAKEITWDSKSKQQAFAGQEEKYQTIFMLSVHLTNWKHLPKHNTN